MALLFLKAHGSRRPAKDLNARNNSSPSPPFHFIPILLAIVLIALAGKWIFGYKERALRVEEIEKSLTPEELGAYQSAQSEVDEKFENCIQYILYALEDGLYECANCPPGIPFVTLKEGEIWYIGHTCQDGDDRHTQPFQKKHRVWMHTNYIGSKQECHKVELKLLRGYKYLPESLKPEIKLVLPPYNRTDKN